jgi:protease IV
MAQFFKFLFASCLGTALALVLLTFIGISALTGVASSASQTEKVQIRPNAVLKLDFKNVVPEKTNNLPMDPFDFENQSVVGLTDFVASIKKAKEDPDIKGIYINAPVVMAGKASSSVLRDALLDFKQSGKFIMAYADFYTQGAYYLASTADSLFLNPVGAVDFRGLSSTITYYKGMLDKLDVDMKIYYAGQFKSATEPFRTDKMSDQNRLQVREYLGGLYEIFIRDIAKSRNMSDNELKQVADRFDGFSAQKSVSSRLVDRLAYEDEVFAAMKKKIGMGEKEKLQLVSLEDYYDARGKKLDLTTKDKIAVVYAEGDISDGASTEAGGIYSEDYVKILRKIRQDDNVKAVVLRVNSPGGSSMASEAILREVQLCKQAGKPIVVSMGDLAASGGYYIACQADSIFAQPNTITGSIGVFGIMPHLAKTMRKNLGITADTVRTGRFSAFGSLLVEFSPEEDALIQNRVEQTYEEFLQRVATGRKKTRDQVHEMAQGRVWTGAKAKELGLVDEIGGLDRAIAAAAKLAGVEKYRTSEFPRSTSGIEQFIERFSKKKNRDDSVKSWLMREELGDMYPMYQSLIQLRKSNGLQARLPYELIVR